MNMKTRRTHKLRVSETAKFAPIDTVKRKRINDEDVVFINDTPIYKKLKLMEPIYIVSQDDASTFDNDVTTLDDVEIIGMEQPISEDLMLNELRQEIEQESQPNSFLVAQPEKHTECTN
jgi:hypothetical protein